MVQLVSTELTALFLCVVGIILVVITSLGILLLVRGSIFFGSIKEFCQNRLAILSLIYIILAFLFVLHEWTLFTPGINLTDSNKGVYYISGVVFASCIPLFYTSLVQRVYITFMVNNEHALSQREIRLLIIFICLQFTALLFQIIYNKENTLDVLELNVVTICAILIDICVNILVLYLFLKRLYRMVLNLDESFQSLMMEDMEDYSSKRKSMVSKDSQDEKQNENENDISLYRSGSYSDSSESNRIMVKIEGNATEQTQIVDIMAKITLLTIISEILFCIWVILFLSILNAEYSDTLKIIQNIMLEIWLCFNCFALYATLIFNNDHYIMCCGLCHNCFKTCCANYVAKRSIQNRFR